MKFLKNYNVTKLRDKMIKTGELMEGGYGIYKEVYICEDVHDFWVYRILEGYNEDYEKEEGKFMLESEKINKYEVAKYLGVKNTIDKHTKQIFLSVVSEDILAKTILKLDEDNGLESWDIKECDSIEEAIDCVDGGYGIEELEVN